MASSSSPISDQLLQRTTSSASDRARRKRKKKPPPPQNPSPSPPRMSLERWRSEKQQQIYSTKLVQALRELRISRSPDESAPWSSTPRGGRAVREVADRALAVAARGRTLWSRALLASKSVKLRFRKQKRRRISNPAIATATAVSVTGGSRSRKQRAPVVRLNGKKSLPPVQRKVKVLSRLVPGCRKQPLPVVLEETTDYIAAMQMQIRAMTTILNAVSSSSAPPQQSPETPPAPAPAHDGEQTHRLG